MGARFGEAALAGVHEGQTHILILRQFWQVVSEDYIFAFLLPGFVIEVAYLTAVASFAESAGSSPISRAFEAIKNCSAKVYSTRSIVNGEGVHWEKAEGGSQNRTTSSLTYVSDAS